jgi:hypothetical protein
MTGLREEVLGAWELASFSTRDVDTGQERHPLGTEPRGLIVYTPDGHMSAQLARADMSDYVAYGGPFDADEESATLHHDVTMSTMPELLTTPQFRHAVVDGDRLVLSATTTDDDGVTVDATLIWVRAQR